MMTLPIDEADDGVWLAPLLLTSNKCLPERVTRGTEDIEPEVDAIGVEEIEEEEEEEEV